jgi:hypothetical protein
VPLCTSSAAVCNVVQAALDLGEYSALAQNNVLFLEFYQDVNREADFLKYCSFLPEINNLNSINQTYKANMMTLDAFVMVAWPNATLFSPADR